MGEHSGLVSQDNQFLHELLQLGFEEDGVADGILMNPYGSMVQHGDQFYSYLGSLTTPPCTPNLVWIMMKRLIHITQADIDKFESYLMSSQASQTDGYGRVDRPVQPLNGRSVKLGHVSL